MIVLNAAEMTQKAEAHAYLADRLSFPDYYGKNLDALFDCLTELDETDIRFVNLLSAADTYFAKLLPVFQDAESENPRLRLFYQF